MNPSVLESLSSLPSGVSSYELSAWHLILILTRNGGNRSQAAEEMKVCIRTVHKLILSMRVGGYQIPEYQRSSNRKPRESTSRTLDILRQTKRLRERRRRQSSKKKPQPYCRHPSSSSQQKDSRPRQSP